MAMKACSKCKIEKEETKENFYWRGDKYGLRSACKSCFKARVYIKKRRKRTVAFKESKARGNRLRKQKHKEHLINLLGGVCLDCKMSYPPECLDFDHIEPSKKSYNVSQKLHLSLDTLTEEALKCELRCSNCHRTKTSREGQWGKATGAP